MVSDGVEYKYVRGVALVQVLLMTAIMSLIAIQFNLSAKNQVEVASEFHDRLDAELALRTTRSKVLSHFFENDPYEMMIGSPGNVKWNFRNKKVKIDDVASVRIQSAAGLLSITSISDEMLEDMLHLIGFDRARAQILSSAMKDWTDNDSIKRPYGAESSFYAGQTFARPRNGPLQHISEIKYIGDMSASEYALLQGIVTPYTTPFFNPMLSPDVILNGMLGEEAAKSVPDILTGDEDVGQLFHRLRSTMLEHQESFDPHPWSVFSLEVSVAYNDIRLTENLDIRVQTQQTRDPIIILRKY